MGWYLTMFFFTGNTRVEVTVHSFVQNIFNYVCVKFIFFWIRLLILILIVSLLLILVKLDNFNKNSVFESVERW